MSVRTRTAAPLLLLAVAGCTGGSSQDARPSVTLTAGAPQPSEPTPQESPSDVPDPEQSVAPPAQLTPSDASPTAVPFDQLQGQTVTSPLLVTMSNGAESVQSVKWFVDNGYLEKDSGAPFAVTLQLAKGEHTIEARLKTSDGRNEESATFTVSGGAAPAEAGGTTTSTGPRPAPTGKVPALPGAVTTRRTVRVSTTEQLRDAIATAQPGDLVLLADGTYTGDPQLEASASGTRAAPVVLRGSRRAVITTGRAKGGGYGLHVTGSFWRLQGFTVQNAKKGIVFDGSVGSVVEGVDVHAIGQEGIHFRSGSAEGVVFHCVVHNTGLESPQFGEGIYVGSANSNWQAFGGGPDRSDHVLIQANSISNTPAEGIDIKEGTTGGVVRGNIFTAAGTSGENSADSWVDVKGNGWLVEANTGTGTLLDAFQVHNVFAGWGQGNVFRANVVRGGVPGFVVGIYPPKSSVGNVVSCSNRGSGTRGVSNIPCS